MSDPGQKRAFAAANSPSRPRAKDRSTRRAPAPRVDVGHGELFAACADGVLIIERQTHRVVYANPAAERMFGEDKGTRSLVGWEFGEPTDGSEVELVGADRRLAEMRVSDVGFDGKSAWLVMLRDVSDRVRALEAERGERVRAETVAEARATLLHEIDHRTRNTFTMLSALIGLQRRGAASPELARVLEQIKERIDAVGRSLGALNRSGTQTEVDLETFLPAVLGDLSDLDPDVTLRLDLACASITARRAQYVGLIVHELVRNAIKYAYPGAASGEVRVTCRRSDKIELSVEDRGVGFDADENAGGSGLGTELNRTFARMLGGTLTIETGPTGTRSTLRFPADG